MLDAFYSNWVCVARLAPFYPQSTEHNYNGSRVGCDGDFVSPGISSWLQFAEAWQKRGGILMRRRCSQGTNSAGSGRKQSYNGLRPIWPCLQTRWEATSARSIRRLRGEWDGRSPQAQDHLPQRVFRTSRRTVDRWLGHSRLENLAAVRPVCLRRPRQVSLRATQTRAGQLARSCWPYQGETGRRESSRGELLRSD